MGDNQGAITVYEEMSELLFSNFGIMPSEDLRELHRKAARTVNDRAVSMSTVQEQLREPDGPRGALICEYDFFQKSCITPRPVPFCAAETPSTSACSPSPMKAEGNCPSAAWTG